MAEKVEGKSGKKGKDLEFSKLGDSTAAVQGGERKGRPNTSDTITTPIALTSSYWFSNTQQVIDFNEGRYESFEYGRYGNPTVAVAEEKLALLDNGESALLSASGMSSCTTMLLALMSPGKRLLTTTDCYRRTRQFIQTFLPKMDVSCTVLDPSDIEGLKAALEVGDVSIYFSETPTNPYLRCVDISTIASLCKAKNVIVAIDSTFATPINLKPIDFGADLVLHSATKYLGGHNDLIAGALIGKKELIDKIRAFHGVLGGIYDPHSAYLLIRGLKTLQLRVKQANQTALEIAKRLEDHPKIERVYYPGLPSHPDHQVALKHFRGGFGGVVCFVVKGGLEAAAKVIDGVQIPYIAPSLGGVESLIEQPTVMSYWNVSKEDRAKIGIEDGLVRFSCGIEDTKDIVEDLEQSLDKL
eukprot:TRINITY_DN8731_c0_g1_i1.p1 TRINITY_DN8731_c0_g1~~TRINITY_DN8731_c0_g1_i1.p1  ORF type:complete len:413 (+),score=153.30 TRINITY_DN8731_c0_g1_i1:130-1368(+)